MVQRDKVVKNAARREHLSQQSAKTKSKGKLSRRLEIKKAEAADATGELRRERLAKNVPRTIERTREWVGGEDDDDDELEGEEQAKDGEDGDEDMPFGGSDDEEDDSAAKEATKASAKSAGDARTRPVKIKSTPGQDGESGEQGELELDMAGLEDLFHRPSASTDPNAPPPGPILLTTSPRPHGPTYAFLNELQSLLGGKKHAEIIVRKNARFELSKVVKWAKKRGYSAIAVVGEDLKGEPATLTLSLLPYGPTAHFRLTSTQLHRSISNSANPTSHIPELVLSNFSTPLGLSTGRLLQSLFPPMPNFIGRQVVAIHNQRDFIFVRRFRYMFALRGDNETAIKLAKERGMDEQLRTRMQEIGPRFTLKLRWLKRGTLDEGRRRGAGGTTQNTDEAKKGEEGGMDIQMDGEDKLTQKDKEDEKVALKEMLEQTGGEPEEEEGASFTPAAQAAPSTSTAPVASTTIDATMSSTDTPSTSTSTTTTAAATAPSKKRKRIQRTFSPSGQSIRIPSFTAPASIPKSELPHHRKLKKNASLLDSLAVTVGLGRGGTRKEKKEWEWDPRMQVSRRKFFL